jgi:hypothetical protein
MSLDLSGLFCIRVPQASLSSDILLKIVKHATIGGGLAALVDSYNVFTSICFS